MKEDEGEERLEGWGDMRTGLGRTMDTLSVIGREEGECWRWRVGLVSRDGRWEVENSFSAFEIGVLEKKKNSNVLHHLATLFRQFLLTPPRVSILKN